MEWAKRKVEKASGHLLACVSLHLGPWAVPRDLGSDRVTHCHQLSFSAPRLLLKSDRLWEGARAGPRLMPLQTGT